MSLIEFLRARLDELEKRTYGTGRVAWLTYRDSRGGMLYTTVASATIEMPDHWVVDGREAAGSGGGVERTVDVIYDARQVLADVDAKRAIVELHSEAEYDVQGERTCVRCVDPNGWTVTPLPAEERWPCLTLRMLALPYVDHPDYDEAWRPADV